MAVQRGSRDRIEGLVRSIFDPSIDALHAFFNQVGIQLVDGFRTSLESAYAESQLHFPYTSTNVSSVGATSTELHNSVSSGRKGGAFAGTSPSAPVPPKPSTPPAKWSHDCSKKARR